MFPQTGPASHIRALGTGNALFHPPQPPNSDRSHRSTGITGPLRAKRVHFTHSPFTKNAARSITLACCPERPALRGCLRRGILHGANAGSAVLT